MGLAFFNQVDINFGFPTMYFVSISYQRRCMVTYDTKLMMVLILDLFPLLDPLSCIHSPGNAICTSQNIIKIKNSDPCFYSSSIVYVSYQIILRSIIFSKLKVNK